MTKEIFCYGFSLVQNPNIRWRVGVRWHRLPGGKRLPPGWTGGVELGIDELPDPLRQDIEGIITEMEQFVLHREAEVQKQLGFSGIQLFMLQVQAYNASAWEQGEELVKLSGGIGIQYHRLRGKAVELSPWWNGSLLFDKQPDSMTVTVNRADKEVYKTAEQAEELVQRIQAILEVGSKMAIWLDQKERR